MQFESKKSIIFNLTILFSFKLAEKDVFMNVATIRNDKEFQTIFELNLTNDSLHKSQSN